MRTCIQKWGNSLAVRIPKSFADNVKLKQGSKVEILPVAGKLVISPVAEVEFTLEDLLAKITEENCHHEVNTGQPIGNEAW